MGTVKIFKSKNAQIGTDTSGWIYVVQIGDSYFYKIGSTTNKVKKRIAILQVANPLYLYEFCRFFVKDKLIEAEAKLHEVLKGYHYRGEWFHIPRPHILESALAVVRMMSTYKSLG